MEKTLKLVVVCALIFSLGYMGLDAAKSYKVQDVTMDQNNNAVHPLSEGKSYTNFASTTEAVICTGRCLLYDIILSSGADGAYAIIKDSATADGSGSDIFARLEFDGTGIQSMAQGSNAFPIVTSKGITADLSSVGSNEELLIIWKDLD